MTLDERIETLARHMYGYSRANWGAEDEQLRSHYRHKATEYIRTAFPELFSNPPMAWIAPWDPTTAMAAVGDPDMWGIYGGEESYRRMRDVYLR